MSACPEPRAAGAAPAELTDRDWQRGPFLIVTRHDYRTLRKVNLHHYADQLRSHGKVRFFSVGFSYLSRLNMDARVPLWARSNQVENIDGVDCYLWRTAGHPINLRARVFDGLAASLFASYARRAPALLCEWAANSGYILIESGLPIIFFESIKRTNRTARIAYFASDDLDAIGCSPALRVELDRTIGRYDWVFSPSRRLAAKFSAHIPGYCLPYGVEPGGLAAAPSPYEGGVNAVTAGSTLFDPSFFAVAAEAFPHITFHLLGCGAKAVGLQRTNVRVYPEVPFESVLNFFRHAEFGIAPYDPRGLDPYFAESSQKLAYMGILGVPAVCPEAAVGSYPGRFGYVPGDPASIAEAIRRALASGHFSGQPALSWAEVTARLLAPKAYPDTRV